MINQAECTKRIQLYEKVRLPLVGHVLSSQGGWALQQGTSSFYILSIDSNTYVDARDRANQARFINHCCDPNCVTQVGSKTYPDTEQQNSSAC